MIFSFIKIRLACKNELLKSKEWCQFLFVKAMHISQNFRFLRSRSIYYFDRNFFMWSLNVPSNKCFIATGNHKIWYAIGDRVKCKGLLHKVLSTSFHPPLWIKCLLQGITKIADLTSCSNITVLYLYNNKIKTIEALESAPNIQLLYLQNNKIARMSGLQNLKKLKKLYLTRNKIQVLEGLMENKQLEVKMMNELSSQ